MKPVFYPVILGCLLAGVASHAQGHTHCVYLTLPGGPAQCYTAPDDMAGPPVGEYTITNDFATWNPAGIWIPQDISVASWCIGTGDVKNIDFGPFTIAPGKSSSFWISSDLCANQPQYNNQMVVWCVGSNLPVINGTTTGTFSPGCQ